MPFRVVIRNDLSLAQLAEMSRNGQSVMKSPHVGNFYPNNLAVASLGIFMNAYDRTIGSKDKLFHPHCVIAAGHCEQIANPNLLTTHNRIVNPSKYLHGRFPQDGLAATAHISAVRDAIPGVNISTYTQYLQQHRDLTIDILMIAAELMPHLWTRCVYADGHTWNDRVYVPQELTRKRIYGLSSETAGLIIPNILNILISGITEALRYNTKEVYHLSGPVMVHYINEMINDLNRLYDHVRRRLVCTLPEELVFNLIPVADMRFVAIDSQKTELNELIETYLVFTHEERQLKQTASAYPIMDMGKPGVWQQLLERNDKAAKQLRTAVTACDFVFYKTEQATYTSQYDLLLGKQLYLHPFGVETPIRDVSVAIKIMKEIRSRQHKPRRPEFVKDTISGGIK